MESVGEISGGPEAMNGKIQASFHRNYCPSLGLILIVVEGSALTSFIYSLF
jgi:hypothetical protein